MAKPPSDLQDISSGPPSDLRDAVEDRSIPKLEYLAEERKRKPKDEPGILGQAVGAVEAVPYLAQNVPVSLMNEVLFEGYPKLFTALGKQYTPQEKQNLQNIRRKFEEKLMMPMPNERVQAFLETLGSATERLPPTLGMGGELGALTQLAKPAAIAAKELPAVQKAAELGGKGVEKAKALAEGLKTSIPSIPTTAKAQKGAQALAQTVSEAERAGRAEESARRGVQETRLRETGKEFGAKAQTEREAAARKLSNLGQAKPVGDFGDEMQSAISKSREKFDTARATEAKKDFNDYFEQAAGFENSPSRENMMNRLKVMATDPNVGSPGRAAAEEAYKKLQKSTTARGAEIEFRKFFGEASAPQQVGYGAEEQKANRAISDIIGEALDTHAPKRVVARNKYKEFSSPLDAFETQLGKRAVKEEAGVPGRLQMKPSDYPSYFFKDRDTVRALREQLGNDEAAVNKFATQHAVNELQGKNASQAQQWAQTNSQWLKEVPTLETRVGQYVSQLSQAEQQATKLEKGATALGKKAGEVGRSQEAVQAKLTKDLRDLELISPDKVSTKASQMIRDLEYFRLIPPEKASAIRQQIEAVDKAYQGAEKSRQIKKLLLYYGVGSYIGYKGVSTVFGM